MEKLKLSFRNETQDIQFKSKNLIKLKFNIKLRMVYFLALLFVVVIGVFYFNTFTWLVESWINNIYYSHGFLVPVISGYVVWGMREELAGIEKKQAQEGLMLFITGIALQGISVLWTMRFISGISLVLTVSGAILYLFGREFLKKIAFPVLFLFLMIPLPFVDIVAPPIQTISAITSSNLANLLGMPVQREGLQLILPASTFEVGLECSGLRSIISLFTLASLYAYILEGGLAMKFIIVASSIPLALAGNILRIISVLAVANIYGASTAIRYFHDFSSLLMFSVALVGLFLVGRCFGRLRFRKIF